MTILKNYYSQILKHDFLNKFNYKNINQIPKIKKIILNFNCKSFDLKKITTAILTLELISAKKSYFTKSKRASINLKLKKGHPVGCKVILEKDKLDNFLLKLLNKILPELKNFKGLKQEVYHKNSFSFSLKDLTNFDEIKSNFYLFTNLPSLNITFVYTTNSVKELSFFLYLLKIPLTQVKN